MNIVRLSNIKFIKLNFKRYKTKINLSLNLRKNIYHFSCCRNPKGLVLNSKNPSFIFESELYTVLPCLLNPKTLVSPPSLLDKRDY